MVSNAALIAATKHTAVSVAKHGVLVNSVAPGMIATPDGTWGNLSREHSDETLRKFYDQVLPMRRFGWPEPVGSLIAFLCSDRAAMITGACIPVDGGQGRTMYKRQLLQSHGRNDSTSTLYELISRYPGDRLAGKSGSLSRCP